MSWPSSSSKRVHFASVNTCYTIPHREQDNDPSPLHVPPPLPPTWGHHHHQMAPVPHFSILPRSSSRSSPLIHSILSASSSSLPLNWDMSLPAATALSHGHSVQQSLYKPATDPPFASITVVCPYLPWQFDLPFSNGRHITVYDVLEGIYRSLRKQITDEKQFRKLSRENQRRVAAAYQDRCSRIRDRRAATQEREMGLRIIDFLMGCTRFAGLTMSSKGPGVWTLNVK